jgi:hypothetical protein
MTLPPERLMVSLGATEENCNLVQNLPAKWCRFALKWAEWWTKNASMEMTMDCIAQR